MNALPSWLDDLLDRGIDPLADGRTQRWLDDHPESLPAFVHYLDSLAALGAPVPTQVAGSPTRVRRLRPWTPMVVLGGVAAAAAVLVALRSPPAAGTAPLPRPAVASGEFVRVSRTTSSVEGVRESLRSSTAPGRAVRVVQSTYRVDALPCASVPVCRLSLTAERRFGEGSVSQ